MYISTLPSPEVENFQMKIYYPAVDRTPDLLNQRQTCYHLSQRGEPWYQKVEREIEEAAIKFSIGSLFPKFLHLSLQLSLPVT